MAALDYTNLTAMKAFLAAQVAGSNADEAEALLEASAADDCGTPPTTVYRPYWVIAHLLESGTASFEEVQSATGSRVKYRDPRTAYRAIMRRQHALDQTLCNIPAGFEAMLAGGIRSASLSRAYE